MGLYNLSDEKYWLWNDVRGLTGVTASFDRYTQPGEMWRSTSAARSDPER
ncbi:MAG: hypothetical protein IPL06_17700 [Betaproteobacteria bacterium]|nr:hypothetical protein [Betaproteobacteria bacterium]